MAEANRENIAHQIHRAEASWESIAREIHMLFFSPCTAKASAEDRGYEERRIAKIEAVLRDHFETPAPEGQATLL